MTLASRWLAITTVTLVTACGSDSPEENSTESASLGLDKQAIAQQVYDDDRVPEGFYAEPPRAPGAFYSIQHVKASDLSTPGGEYELCNDDFAMALSYSEQLNATHPQTGALNETSENTRYFEFVRSLPGNVAQYRVERVFKCSYLDRSSYDSTTGAAGVINLRPLSNPQLKTIAEYFWTFSEYNNVGSVVISSDGQAATPNLRHRLHLARLLPGAGRDGCDYVELIEWQYESNQDNGTLFASEMVVGGFSAQKTTAGVEICQ